MVLSEVDDVTMQNNSHALRIYFSSLLDLACSLPFCAPPTSYHLYPFTLTLPLWPPAHQGVIIFWTFSVPLCNPARALAIHPGTSWACDWFLLCWQAASLVLFVPSSLQLTAAPFIACLANGRLARFHSVWSYILITQMGLSQGMTV